MNETTTQQNILTSSLSDVTSMYDVSIYGVRGFSVSVDDVTGVSVPVDDVIDYSVDYSREILIMTCVFTGVPICLGIYLIMKICSTMSGGRMYV